VAGESGALAKQFQLDAIAANGGIKPGWIHADNGPASARLLTMGSGGRKDVSGGKRIRGVGSWGTRRDILVAVESIPSLVGL
jgi:hypothetical protein